MKIEVKYPSPSLSDIVKCYWTLEKGNEKHTERLYPCGETQIIFHYRNPFVEITKDKSVRQSQSIACGQLTTYKDILANESAGMIGIIFQPYSLNTILHVATDELTHESLSLTGINKIFGELTEKIAEANSTQKRIDIMENFLLKRISINNKSHFDISKASIAFLSSDRTNLSIKDLANIFSLSERQFERIFKDYVGVTPKYYSEIEKFKRAYTLLHHRSDLTSITYLSGYYDQSHFIRSFKKFTGKTPGEFLRPLK